MKPMMSSAFFLIFTLVILSSYSNLSSADHEVLDIDGNPLCPGVAYYIVPVIPREGGGLGLGQMQDNKDNCPLNVIQEQKKKSLFKDVPFKFPSFGFPQLKFPPIDLPPKFVPVDRKENLGQPVKFLPANKRDKMVVMSSDVNIVFETNLKAKCDRFTTVWQVDDSESNSHEPMTRYVTINGKVGGNPGRNVVSKSLFKIEQVAEGKNGYYYKIVYCPDVCHHCHVDCGTLGVVKINGVSFVGVDHVDEPLIVEFMKADNI